MKTSRTFLSFFLPINGMPSALINKFTHLWKVPKTFQLLTSPENPPCRSDPQIWISNSKKFKNLNSVVQTSLDLHSFQRKNKKNKQKYSKKLEKHCFNWILEVDSWILGVDAPFSPLLKEVKLDLRHYGQNNSYSLCRN